MWNNKVIFYPKGVTVGPDCPHEGPEYVEIFQKGFYVWEYWGGPPKNLGCWVLRGPFRSEEVAKANF